MTETSYLLELQHRNDELEKLVAEKTEELLKKNRDLEIEASLERVRAVALSMKKPDDLLSICKILFAELLSLGFSELRNAMINIHDDDKGSFLNYDFSEAAGPTITTIFYNSHPATESLVKQIRKKNDAFAEFVIKDDELDRWREYRKQMGEQDDARLDNVSALYYYFYSIGIGGIGISTYGSITEEKRNLLKRFRNVFNLAYRRYMDVALAEAQTREAKIEASLERVRADAMAMHSSEDLSAAVSVFFKELKTLGVLPWRCGVGRIDEATHITDLTTTSITKDGDSFQVTGKLKQEGHPVLEAIYDNWILQREYYPVLRGKEIKAYYDVVNPQIAYPVYPSDAVQYGHMIYFKEGFVFAWTEKELNEEELGIFRRFTSVLSLTYRRFLDLREAESQARQAKIEASLERVRARSLAMHNSDELVDASIVLFKELKTLGIEPIRTGVGIVDSSNDTLEIWSSQLIEEKRNKILGVVPFKAHPFFEGYYEAWKRKELYFFYEIAGNDVKEYYKTMSSILSYPDSIEINPRELFYTFFFPEGSLNVVSQNHLSEDECNLMTRFARVFGLIYRRFLDLEKAEGQAREAQVELALERVRARTMAMQNSNELSETAYVLFQQFNELGDDPDQITIGIINEEEGVIEFWVTMEGKKLGLMSKFPIEETDVIHKIYIAWKENKKSLVIDIQGKELHDYIDYRIRLTGVSSKNDHSHDRRVIHTAFFSKGLITISTHEPRPQETIQLLERFAGVFDLTYTRFLDLQKAESQTRKTMIEIGLERVRSKTMAMHNSREVGETVAVMFDELRKLGIETYRCGIGIMDEVKEMEVWTAKLDDKGKVELIIGYLDMSMHPLLKGALDSWKNKKETYCYHLNGKDLIKYFNAINEHENYPVKYNFDSLPEEIFHYDFYFNEGTLFVFTLKQLSSEDESTFKRFAGVFGQTYRRYLDLQKAEAQTREAQIEAALEKVRGRAMAMHNSSDLSETASIIFTELRKLGINPKRCGVVLLSKDSRSALLYAATTSSNSDELALIGTLDLSGHPCHEMQYESWLKKEIYFPVLSGEELKSYYDILSSQLSMPSLAYDQVQHEEYGYYLPFSEGSFYAWTEKPYSETEINILNRFKAIIDLTFRRYFDLQKAEAQARESQIEAALERVRSKAMAMQKSEDLAEAVSIVFEELDKLKLGMLRCGIGIINKEKRSVDFWSISISEHGSALEISGDESMDTHPLLQGAFDAWLGQGDFSYILQGEDLIKYYKSLPESQSILLPSESVTQFYYVATFQAGGLFAFRETTFPDEAKTVMKRFADVFNLTYTRFNDLKQAEQQTHKAQIEVALERVRARALAMQEPEELIQVAQVLRHEMGLLGVEELETGTIFTHDESSDKVECWFAIKDTSQDEKRLVSDHITIDLNQTWVGREMRQFYNSDKKQISILMRGNERREWIEYCYSLSSKLKGFYGDNIPDRTYHLYKSSDGVIGAASPGDLSEESWDLLKRAASVFSLAYSRFKDLTKARLDLKQLKEEKKRSESLLLNILPEEIANELKQFGKSYARKHEQVSILFADIKGFSSIAEDLPADDLVTQLDECFRAFDNIIDKHGMEKIKTIGDAYICASGLPRPVPDNAIKTVRAALDMIDFIKGFGLTKKIQNLPVFEFRVGIHTGSVITGVVGLKKFTYDIWGDAVNMAARMEQHGEAGKINISGFTYQLVKDKFKCSHRGKIEAKNKGEVDMYFVESAIQINSSNE